MYRLGKGSVSFLTTLICIHILLDRAKAVGVAAASKSLTGGAAHKTVLMKNNESDWLCVVRLDTLHLILLPFTGMCRVAEAQRVREDRKSAKHYKHHQLAEFAVPLQGHNLL